MTFEELILKANRITELRLALAQMSMIQSELIRLEAEVSAATRGAVSKPRKRLEDQVREVIEADGAKIWDAESLARRLGARVPSIRAALSKLASSSRVVRVATNKYRGCASGAGL